jgi:hypothetical protein
LKITKDHFTFQNFSLGFLEHLCPNKPQKTEVEVSHNHSKLKVNPFSVMPQSDGQRGIPKVRVATLRLTDNESRFNLLRLAGAKD